ncbi:MAG: hypothetical protein AAF664_19525 [Planctomycetota bacterium]
MIESSFFDDIHPLMSLLAVALNPSPLTTVPIVGLWQKRSIAISDQCLSTRFAKNWP